MMKEIDNVTVWLQLERNIRYYKNSRSQAHDLIQKPLTYIDCVSLASNFREFSVWWANHFLNDLVERNLQNSVSGTQFLESRFYYTRILVAAIDTPGAGARVWAEDVQMLFFLLLTFNRNKQALWIGGITYMADTPERFSGRNDLVLTLREVSEWESIGGDVHGWRGIVTRLRRLIPGQKDTECCAGQLEEEPMFPYWQEKPLCGYMLRLWLVLSGQIQPNDVPAGHPGCGVYEGLFTNWDKIEALEQSLIDTCDYHLLRSSDDGNDDYDIPEFSLRPYNVIPFEILAYRNVRRNMGLETPWPEHPLLDSPFVRNLPDELPPSDDPLLGDVLAAVRKVLPDV